MLANIVDHRTNAYCVNIDAVVEASFHDNCIEGATQFPETDWSLVETKYNTTVSEAVEWANKLNQTVTLYIYDLGSKPCG